jgi:nicotinamidase-related amidase
MKTSPQSRTASFVIAGLIVVAVSVSIHLRQNAKDLRSVRSVSQAATPHSESMLHSALVVIDVQNDFWIPEVASSAPEFEARLRELMADCRRHGLPVIHVRTQYDENLSNWPQQFLSTHQQSQLCLEGSPGEHPLSCAREMEDEAIFVKGNFDAFSNEQFAAYLQELGIQKLYLCGLYTDVCILSTGMSAFNRGYHVTLISDCCASTRATHEFVIGRYTDFIFSEQKSESVRESLRQGS